MARGPKKRGKPRKAAQLSRRISRAGRDELSLLDKQRVDAVVGRDAQRHGIYEPVDFKIQEVVEGGKVKAKTVKVVRNLGGTPVERWAARGKLDERQMAAIMFYQEAWRCWLGEPRVTANYSPAIARSAQGAIELWASSKLRAKEALRLLDQEVFFNEPVGHFHVWQNVVIWDEPAGVAGGRVGFVHKPAEAVALLIIQTMAFKIANVVLDRSKSDFGDLLLDLDAARRPGRKRA